MSNPPSFPHEDLCLAHWIEKPCPRCDKDIVAPEFWLVLGISLVCLGWEVMAYVFQYQPQFLHP